MGSYYNENDPFAAAWLRNLISANLISPGEVDERSIEDVRPDDLRGFTQCHFFAGIGVWSYALRQAGWPDDRPVWTGSCPCQPFSAAGKRKGAADERHLWPAFFHLIQSGNPEVIFGEQVASKDGLAWFDTVSSDLEATDYTLGAADLCAAGFGAPHIRQRLYFVAESDTMQRNRRGNARQGGRFEDSNRRVLEHPTQQQMGLPGCAREPRSADVAPDFSLGSTRQNDFWSECIWLPCIDGKARPTERRLLPMVDGSPADLGYVRDEDSYILSPLIQKSTHRIGRLRGYGNAIVAPVAQAFIEAYLECCP